jgi:hypothetical protein
MQILFIKGKPMADPIENKLSLFNEVMVTFYLIICMPLTGVKASVDFLLECGFALIVLILFTFLVNILAFLYFVTQDTLSFSIEI